MNLFGLLHKIPALKPKTATYFYNKAVLAYQQAKWQHCIELLTRCLELNADFIDAHYNMASAYQQLGDKQQAQTHLETALSLKPDDNDAQYNLGLIYLENEEWQKALKLFNNVLSQNPEDVSALVGKGLALIEMDDEEKAKEAFLMALSYNPEVEVAHRHLAYIEQAKANYPQALEHFSQVLKTCDTEPQLYLDASLVAAKLNEWKMAMDFALKCVYLDPENARGYNQLGLTLYCQDQCEEAIVHFSTALQLDPLYNTVYNNLAFAYEKNNQLDQALEALHQYLDTIDDPPERELTEAHMKELLRKGAKP